MRTLIVILCVFLIASLVLVFKNFNEFEIMESLEPLSSFPGDSKKSNGNSTMERGDTGMSQDANVNQPINIASNENSTMERVDTGMSQDASVNQLINIAPKEEKLKFVHIINPFQADPEIPGDQFYSQPIAFQSIIHAKQFSQNLDRNVEIQLFSITEKKDANYAPEEFKNLLLPQNFESKYGSIFEDLNFEIKPMPFIKDIFIAAAEHAKNGEYIIYTNADICLYEDFYVEVEKLIRNEKHDAIVVPRENDIPRFNTNGQRFEKFDLETLFSFRGTGKAHLGGDTFIIKKEIYVQTDLDELLVGTVRWDGVFKSQLKSTSQNYLLGGGLLTFHLGKDDSAWNNKKNNSPKKFNIKNTYLSCWNLFVSEIRCQVVDKGWYFHASLNDYCSRVGKIYCKHFEVYESSELCSKSVS